MTKNTLPRWFYLLGALFSAAMATAFYYWPASFGGGFLITAAFWICAITAAGCLLSFLFYKTTTP